MIRALLAILPVAFFAFNANATCDLPVEFMNEKISDSCRADLMAKATDAQDKVYLERIFKGWKPMTDYEFTTGEGGLVEIINKKTGEGDQFMWISQEPAILFLNGQVITDENKDPSMYRRFERMIEKADDAYDKQFNEKSASVWLRVLGPESANARNRRAAGDPLQTAGFIYTIDGAKDMKGTVTEITSKEGDKGWVPGFMGGWSSLKDLGYLPKTQDKTIVCGTNGTLGSISQELGGKNVKITQTSRTDFSIEGLVDKQVIKISMKPGAGNLYVTDKEGKRVTKAAPTKKNPKRRVPIAIQGDACQSKYNHELAGQCKDAWQKFVDGQATEEDKKLVRDYIDKQSKTKNAAYGKSYRCGDIYPSNVKENKAKKDACDAHFAKVVPKGQSVTVNSAAFQACDEKGGKCKAITPEKLAGLRGTGARSGAYSEPEQRKSDSQARARKAYVDAIKTAVKEKESTIQVDEKAMCPAAVVTGNIPAAPTYDGGWGGGTPTFEYPPCTSPDKYKAFVKPETYKQLVKLYEVTKGGNAVAAEDGAIARKDIERRAMGMMMLNECCSDASGKCQETVKKNLKIELNGGKAGSSLN